MSDMRRQMPRCRGIGQTFHNIASTLVAVAVAAVAIAGRHRKA